MFSNLTEKHYTLQISMKGFYREILGDLFIAKKMDWTYSPVQLQPCPVGGCDQTTRRQKPIELCF